MECLLPQHKRMLQESTIREEIVRERGYVSISAKVKLQRLGYSASQLITPTLLIPIWSVYDTDKPSLHHHRPDMPRSRNGKPAKYEFPPKSTLVIDVHPAIREKVRDPSIPLLITEGVKKCDAAISHGLCCIGVIGTWNWRGSNEFNGKTTLPDLDGIAWKDRNDHPRQVLLCYDSDAMLKPQVYQALARFSGVLKKKGAQVAYIYLPHGPDGKKVGLDDYLANGHTTDDLLALATPELRSPPPDEEAKEPSYKETERGLIWLCPTQNGTVEKFLTNFTARIVADVLEDDGAETRHSYVVEARRDKRHACFTVPASSFDALGWASEQLGVGAVCYPGQSIKDHARFAIRILSEEPPEQRVYTHTGWRQIEGGQWVYLHAGGVIGAAVPEGVSVRLSGALQHYALPEPPTGDALQMAVQATLRLLELAADTITFPLVAAVFRAVLGNSDFTLSLAGPSGSFKSELAALAQRHYGQAMDANHLPGSWSSTENALEELAFRVKDALLVIDDFAPTGTPADVQRLHMKADRVMRAQGNTSGRQRLGRDASLRPPRPPRGLILSTGEDVPQGKSLRARQFITEIGPHDIDSVRLTACQQDAANGLYAECLCGFIAWMAPQYGPITVTLHEDIERIRGQAQNTNLHRRTPEIVADLAIGLNYFLQFAKGTGVLTEAEYQQLRRRGWQALNASAEKQMGHQQASDPPQRFLDLLGSALASGRAHIANPEGDPPPNAAAWGWRAKEAGTFGNEHIEWQPHGERVGWVEDDDLYLEKDASYNVAKRLGADAEGITVMPNTLCKRLHEAGLLLSTEPKRGTLSIRKKFQGSEQKVLHLRAGVLLQRKTDISDISDDEAEG